MGSTRILTSLFSLISALQMALAQAPAVTDQPLAPRSIELRDALVWKRISSPTVSADGKWFACRLAPNEGDSEVVLRRLTDGQEWRFPAGETAGQMGMMATSDLVFAENSRWFAFSISPTFRD
ncbi:MAG: hypothetical protein ACK5RS_01935, partial [Acidobacteriota bacterium]